MKRCPNNYEVYKHVISNQSLKKFLLRWGTVFLLGGKKATNESFNEKQAQSKGLTISAYYQ